MVGLVAIGIISAVTFLQGRVGTTLSTARAGFNFSPPPTATAGQPFNVSLVGIDDVWTYDYIGLWASNPGTSASGYYAYAYIQNGGTVDGQLRHKTFVTLTANATVGKQWVCLVRHKNQALGAPPIQEVCRTVTVV